MADFLFWFIVAFVVFGYVLKRVLNALNARHRRSGVPKEMQDHVDEAKYAKMQEYGRVRDRFGLVTGTISFLFLLALLLLGGFAWLDEVVRNVTEHPILMAFLYFGILATANGIIGLPFALYSTFVIEERFGFNKTTPKTFVLDLIKSSLIGAVLGGGLLALLIVIYNVTGVWFWVIALVAVTVITLFFSMFYTSLIVPLFNKLTPLEEGELRDAITEYSKKEGFALKDIYVIDGSKRSTKANAYFSGLGPKKTIVFFDTLLEDMTTDELVAILAHEVGHYRKKHIQKSMVLSTLQTGILLFLFGWLMETPLLAEILGAEQNSFHLGLVAFGLLYSPISMLTGIFMNAFSRKNEYEADAFAKTTYKAEPLITSLKKLTVKNLGNLTPHPLYVFFNYTHPPVLKRIKALRS